MRSAIRLIAWLAICLPALVSAQIDPVKRDFLQLGYDQPVQGHAPLSAYAFYYHNDPDFIGTNITLRLALAPVYLDSELGFVHLLGPQTDFAIGLAGGGFAGDYNEIRGGKWIEGESFDGDSAEISSSIYHLFNPKDLIPLNFMLRGAAHYAAYDANDHTASNFQVPENGGVFSVRTGLRFGGIEPTLFPDLAMELSVWYYGQYRTDSGGYGYDDDRRLNSNTHLFWGSAALDYTLPQSKQSFSVQIIGGASIDPDRVSAYRLGGYLPLAAEYPLSLPGYYYQEFSARQFILVNANYILPLVRDQQWNLFFNGATAGIDYLTGTEGPGQSPGDWVSGVGTGILYRSPSKRLKVMLSCSYGIDAIRTGGRGAESIGLLFQYNLEKTHGTGTDTGPVRHWPGWNSLWGF